MYCYLSIPTYRGVCAHCSIVKYVKRESTGIPCTRSTHIPYVLVVGMCVHCYTVSSFSRWRSVIASFSVASCELVSLNPLGWCSFISLALPNSLLLSSNADILGRLAILLHAELNRNYTRLSCNSGVFSDHRTR